MAGADQTVTELASGVDALYLSGHAAIPGKLFERLEKARLAAAGYDQAMPFEVGGVLFGVEPRSFGRYRFRLAHSHCLVGLTASRSLPPIRIQPRAEFLHAVGPAEALLWFKQIGEWLADGPVLWGLSRLDLFCDVQGWDLEGNDRTRFEFRGQTRDVHEHHDRFTGFEFGRRSTGTVCARIYDKTRHVELKGLDWWPTIWGDRYDRSRQVLRIEFELGRQGLTEYGVRTPDDGLERRGNLWASMTERWLSYRTPTADSTKSRWPIATEWQAIQEASLRGDAAGLERVRAGRNRGELRTTLPQVVGYLATIGAIVGTDNLTSTLGAVRELIQRDEERRGVLFSDRIAERVEARSYR